MVLKSLYRYTLSNGDCSLILPGPYATYILPGYSACPPGEISIEAGSIYCTGCSAGTYSSTESTECNNCDVMNWSLAQSSKCQLCTGGGTSCDSTSGGTLGGWQVLISC